MFMSPIEFCFLHNTSVLSFYINVVLTLFTRTFIIKYTLQYHYQMKENMPPPSFILFISTAYYQRCFILSHMAQRRTQHSQGILHIHVVLALLRWFYHRYQHKISDMMKLISTYFFFERVYVCWEFYVNIEFIEYMHCDRMGGLYSIALDTPTMPAVLRYFVLNIY